MKLCFDIEVSDLTIDSDSETGRVDGVWIDGDNFADKTVEELIIAIVGGSSKWAELISRKTDQQSTLYSMWGKDRSEDEDGVPI